MAGNSTISITFKLDGDNKGFKELTKGAEGLKTMLSQTIGEAKQLKGNVINFAALTQGFKAIGSSIQQFHSFMGSLNADYKTSVENETKLATVMRQRMEATEEDIEAVKRLTMEQRKLGVVDDDAQIAGAQQMGTFLKEKQSLDILIPAMNNLLAQQRGLNATGQDAVTIGNMIGKVMTGQTSALKRVGVSFSEAEENVLKFGTESERAAMLAQIITNNVGEMNAEMGQLPIAKTQDISFLFGDIKDKIAELTNGAEPFLEISAQVGMAASGVGTLVTGIKTLTAAMSTNLKTFALSTAAYVKNKTAMLATAVASKAVAAATTLWTGAQKLLNAVLTMNPLGMVITAVGALTSGVIYAYNHFEGFRETCNRLWGVIQPLAKAITNGLTKALSWLIDKAKQAWEWLSNLLGLSGQKVEVTAKLHTETTGEQFTTKVKDNSYNAPSSTPAKVKAVSTDEVTKVYNPLAKTLRDIRTNIELIDQKLLDSTKEQAASLNMVKEAWQEEEDAILNSGKAIDDNTEIVEDNTLKWNDKAVTLRQIEANISILRERLQDASADEAVEINKTTKLWEGKADAIRSAGAQVNKSGNIFKEGWSGIKGVSGSIEGITSALKSNGNAWKKITSFVDGFISVIQNIKTLVAVINTLTAATNAQAAAEEGKAAALMVTATKDTAATGIEIANSAAKATASGIEAEADTTAAAAKVFKAHAWMPFVGVALAAGMVATLIATISKAKFSVPKFADGGIITGPTLGLMGEYSNAGTNPEVVAPLSDLRKYFGTNNNGFEGGKVEFVIQGRDLRGILQKEMNRERRS